jgi:hypothetical protein
VNEIILKWLLFDLIHSPTITQLQWFLTYMSYHESQQYTALYYYRYNHSLLQPTQSVVVSALMLYILQIENKHFMANRNSSKVVY